MHASPHFKCPQRPPQGGFALVIALSLMAFVLLLLLSITTLVQVESQGAQIQLQRMQAEQSALLGLQIALGELQKTAGPDQRVTATADIFNVSNDPDFEQPHLLGVWKSFKQPNSDTDDIDYAAKKRHEDDNNGHFVQWLSSATVTNQESLAFSAQAPVTPAVELVATGSVTDSTTSGDPSGHVSASTIEIDGTNGIGGSSKYAWHIFDESQKANLTLNKVTPVTDAQRITSLGTGGKPGFQIDATYANLESLSNADRDKLISLDSTGIASFDPVANNAFHVLTTDSKSLLVDVANGGFQKDLSLLFEDATLPKEYKDRHIYSEDNTPLEPAPTRFGGGVNSAYGVPIPSPDPKWSLLHSHYKLYRDVLNSGGKYSMPASQNALFQRGSRYDVVGNPVKNLNPEFSNLQQLLPVISNAQFIFSLATDPGLNRGKYRRIRFITDMVFTLWNPYNVNLEFSDLEIELYRFPLQFEFFRDGVPSTTVPVHFANMIPTAGIGSGWGEQNTLPYRARIQGATAEAAIELKPGEYRVFGSGGRTHDQTFNHYKSGMVLKEGWEDNNGFQSRNFLHDSDSNPIARRLPAGIGVYFDVKPGEVITTRVSAAKVPPSTLATSTGSGILETNNEEPAAYLKFFRGDGGTHPLSTDLNTIKRLLDDDDPATKTRTQIGAIEFNIADADLSTSLPTIEPDDMHEFTVPALTPTPGPYYDNKEPLLIASIRLKTEQDYNENNANSSSMWLHNGITNPYFTNGLDQGELEQTHQYELTWEALTSWSSSPTIEINTDDDVNRGYGGSGMTSGTGVEFAPFLQIPLAPATSIAQFSHAPLNSGGLAPLTTQIVGNSFASPSIPLASKSNDGSLGTHLDHSYMANTTLFDSYFLSTATEETGALYDGTSGRSLNVVLSQFFDGSQELPNSNFEPATSITPTVTATNYDTFAQHLYNKGAFNVNSTSEEAWALFLASGTNTALPMWHRDSQDVSTSETTLDTATASSESAVSRFAPLLGDEMPVDVEVNDPERWAGHRRLTSVQIRALARNVVTEVKARGPFQSVAEFVNRRLIDDSTGNSGALQTAIENYADLNTDFGLAAPKTNSELGGTAGTGNTSDGAASQLTQLDLLNRLAPSITVRGDTFRIRSYGEVSLGTQTVKAWCEAVVQRGHDFVDSSQPSTTLVDDNDPDNSDVNATNQTFGRRFNIVSFRWLSESEI
jgi:hypothetical protein